MPRRDRFLNEVGPEARGSKPVMDVWAHTPERFGMEAVPFVLLPAGAAAGPKPGAAAATSVTRKRNFPRRVFMLPSLAWSRLAFSERGEPIAITPAIENCDLLQRIGFVITTPDGGYGSRIDTSPLRKVEFLHSMSMKQPRETIVSFDATRLGIDSVFLVVLQNEFLFSSPGAHPHCRVFDVHSIFNCGWTGS